MQGERNSNMYTIDRNELFTHEDFMFPILKLGDNLRSTPFETKLR